MKTDIKSEYVFWITIITLILVIFFQATFVFGHGNGFSIEAVVDGYLVDVGLSDENVVSSESV